MPLKTLVFNGITYYNNSGLSARKEYFIRTRGQFAGLRFILYKRLDVTDTLFRQNFVYGNQDTGFFYIPKTIVNGGAEHTHCRAQTHNLTCVSHNSVSYSLP